MGGSYNIPFGQAFHQATVSGTALTLVTFGFTQAQVDAAASAFITIEGDSIRFTAVNGVTPTGSSGHIVPSGSSLTINGVNDLNNFKMIKDTNDATVNVTLLGV